MKQRQQSSTITPDMVLNFVNSTTHQSEHLIHHDNNNLTLQCVAFDIQHYINTHPDIQITNQEDFNAFMFDQLYAYTCIDTYHNIKYQYEQNPDSKELKACFKKLDHIHKMRSKTTLSQSQPYVYLFKEGVRLILTNLKQD